MRQTTEFLLNELMVRYDQAVVQRTRGATREEAAEEAFDRLCDGVIWPAMAQFALRPRRWWKLSVSGAPERPATSLARARRGGEAAIGSVG